MPNHVTNQLTIEGEENIVAFVMNCIGNASESEKQFIDFNKIIPQPAFMFNEDAGEYHEKMADELNVPIWTIWNRANWGTKWNAYRQEKISENKIQFCTAWSAPLPVINVLANKFPFLKITLLYADEDSGSNTGEIVWFREEVIENTPEGGSTEAYEMYFRVHPEDRQNYELIDGEYQYIESE